MPALFCELSVALSFGLVLVRAFARAFELRNPAWTGRLQVGIACDAGCAAIRSHLTLIPPEPYDPPTHSLPGPRHAGFR
jgi:hypothetical protein